MNTEKITEKILDLIDVYGFRSENVGHLEGLAYDIRTILDEEVSSNVGTDGYFYSEFPDQMRHD